VIITGFKVCPRSHLYNIITKFRIALTSKYHIRRFDGIKCSIWASKSWVLHKYLAISAWWSANLQCHNNPASCTVTNNNGPGRGWVYQSVSSIRAWNSWWLIWFHTTVQLSTTCLNVNDFCQICNIVLQHRLVYQAHSTLFVYWI